MKNLLTLMALTACMSTSYSQHRHSHNHDQSFPIVPFIAGIATGVIIYDLNNKPTVIQQPPVIVQQPNVVYPNIIYYCTDTLKPSSVPGNEHIVRTCTTRIP